MNTAKSITSSVASIVALSAASFSTTASAMLCKPDRFAQSSDPTMMIRTRFENADGTMQDEGELPYTASTLAFMKLFPINSIVIDGQGRLQGFMPAFGPVQGVAVPPIDTPLEDVKFDRNGRLVSWRLATAEESAHMQKLQITGPNGLVTWGCRVVDGATPFDCPITVETGEGADVRITYFGVCDAEH